MPAQKKKSAQFRIQFLRAIHEHASVTDLCKQFKISRKTFYKWKTIFEKENHTESRKQGRKATIDERILEMVKQLIVANPEWSVDRLYKEICLANNGQQLVSRRWIQYQLQKSKLSTFAKRQVYSYSLSCA
jgi:transposase-like protein